MKYNDPYSKVRTYEGASPVLDNTIAQNLRTSLKPNAVYLIVVSYRQNNPMHEAILLTSSHSNHGWQIVSNTYDDGSYTDLYDVYAIQVIKELYQFDK